MNQQISPEAVMAAKEVVCEKCQGIFFDQAVALKKLSAIDPNNDTGEAQLIPMGLFVCRNCNTPLIELD